MVTVSEGPEMESDRDRAEWGLDQDQGSDLAAIFGDCSWSDLCRDDFMTSATNRTQFHILPVELRQDHPYGTRRIMLFVSMFLE